MTARILIALSATVILGLGALHLWFTFHGPKLLPRDDALRAAMAQGNLVLTRETSVWNAWIGFNASHSLGALLFGLIYGYLAVAQPGVLLDSPFLLVVGLAMLASYAVLGRLYWFSVPFRGIVLALLSYVAAVVAVLSAA